MGIGIVAFVKTEDINQFCSAEISPWKCSRVSAVILISCLISRKKTTLRSDCKLACSTPGGVVSACYGQHGWTHILTLKMTNKIYALIMDLAGWFSISIFVSGRLLILRSHGFMIWILDLNFNTMDMHGFTFQPNLDSEAGSRAPFAGGF